MCSLGKEGEKRATVTELTAMKRAMLTFTSLVKLVKEAN